MEQSKNRYRIQRFLEKWQVDVDRGSTIMGKAARRFQVMRDHIIRDIVIAGRWALISSSSSIIFMLYKPCVSDHLYSRPPCHHTLRLKNSHFLLKFSEKLWNYFLLIPEEQRTFSLASRSYRKLTLEFIFKCLHLTSFDLSTRRSPGKKKYKRCHQVRLLLGWSILFLMHCRKLDLKYRGMCIREGRDNNVVFAFLESLAFLAI